MCRVVSVVTDEQRNVVVCLCSSLNAEKRILEVKIKEKEAELLNEKNKLEQNAQEKEMELQKKLKEQEEVGKTEHLVKF